MKERTLYILVIVAVLLPLLSSCGTSRIVFDIITQPEIALPGGVENTALLNLVSATIGDNMEDVDEMLKGRGELVNQVAAQSSMNGLKNELQSNTGILPPQIPVTEELINSSSEQNDLSWEYLDNMCTAQGKETVIVLKSFDSRTAIDFSWYEGKTKTDMVQIWTNTIAYDVSGDYVYMARLKAYVDIGWKIYFPGNREIILDGVFPDSVFTETKGMSQNEAERMLPGIKNAIEEAGYIAGAQFASRISPRRKTVERKYFTSGNDDFKQANNFVGMRYWDEAAEYWEKNIENPKPKIAGSARYNLAIVREINGKLEEAIDLVESARKQYQHKLIEAYLQILKNRKSTQEYKPDIP